MVVVHGLLTSQDGDFLFDMRALAPYPEHRRLACQGEG